MVSLSETKVVSPEVCVAGTDIAFNITLHRTFGGVSAPVDLTGKTIKVAWIRPTARFGRAGAGLIDASLEDMFINSTGTLTLGQIAWTLSDTLSVLLIPYTPTDPSKYSTFAVQYYIVEDDYYPTHMHWFHARRSLD